MSLNEIAMLLNILASSLISLQLIFFSKSNLKHKCWVAIVAWLVSSYFASIPIRTLFGEYQHNIFYALINLFIAILILRARGNLSKLIEICKVNFK